MKKRDLMLILTGICFLTACAPVTKKQTDTNMSGKTDGFEETYDKILDSDTSIKIQLTDKVSMDGEVTPRSEYADTMGIYNCRILTEEEDSARAQGISSEKLIDWLNGYYGEMVIDESEVFEGEGNVLESDKLINYMANVEFNVNGVLDTMPMSVVSFNLWENLPSSRMDGETEELRASVDEFISRFPEIFVGHYSPDYQFFHIDDSVYEDAEALAEKSMYDSCLVSLKPEQKEYYAVIIKNGFSEYDIPGISLRDSIDIYDSNHPEYYPDNLYPDETQIFGPDINSLCFLYDKDKKLIHFRNLNWSYFEQEAADSVNVISAKEMIKKLQEQYTKNPPKNNIEISEIRLTYAVQYMGANENGVHQYCAAPAWEVSYYEDTHNYYQADCYSATTGEYVSNVA